MNILKNLKSQNLLVLSTLMLVLWAGAIHIAYATSQNDVDIIGLPATIGVSSDPVGIGSNPSGGLLLDPVSAKVSAYANSYTPVYINLHASPAVSGWDIVYSASKSYTLGSLSSHLIDGQQYTFYAEVCSIGGAVPSGCDSRTDITFTAVKSGPATINVQEVGGSGGTWTVGPGGYTGAPNTVTAAPASFGGSTFSITSNSVPVGCSLTRIDADGVLNTSTLNIAKGQTKAFVINYDCPPPAPPVVTLTANPTSISSGGSSLLTWTLTGGAPTSCNATNDKADAQWNGSKSTVSGSSQNITNITQTTRYTLTCSNAGGSGSDFKDVTVAGVPPPTPTITSATASSCGTGTINVSWSASAGATSYTLRDGASIIYGPGAATSFSHTGLVAGSSHSYTVLATNANGSSAYSSAVVGTAPNACPTPPSVPSVNPITAGACNSGQLTVSWGASTGTAPITYTVYRSSDNVTFNPLAGATNISATSYTDSGLTLGGSYWYKVLATNPAGSSALSGAAGGAVTFCAPTVSVSPSPTCGGKVAITITPSGGATFFNIYRATAVGGPFSAIVSALNSTSYTDTAPSVSTTYYYQVAAADSSGNAKSVVSATASEASSASCPAVPVVTITANPTSGTVNSVNPQLTWSATNAPTTCSATGDWSGAKAVSGSNVAQGVLNTIKTYNYSLYCTNAGGNGPQANVQVVVSGVSHVTSLQYSLSADRSNPQNLNGANITANTNVYIFTNVNPTSDVTNVQFKLDGGAASDCTSTFLDPCTHNEATGPYDLASTGVPNANPFQFSATGSHTITSALSYTAPTPGDNLSAVFTVSAPTTATMSVVEVGASGGTWTINPGGLTGTPKTVTPAAAPGGTTYTITSNTAPANFVVSSISSTDGPGSTLNLIPGQSKQFTITYTAAPPSFDYSMSATDVSVVQGGAQGQSTVTENLVTAPTEAVTITASGVPAGVTVSYSNRTCNPGSTCPSFVNFTPNLTAPGVYTAVTVSGDTTPPRVPHFTTLQLTVTSPPTLSANVTSPAPSPCGGSAYVGVSCTFTCNVVGGIGPYTYIWSGTDFPVFTSPVPSSVTVTYNTVGTKTVTCTVTDLGTNNVVTSPPYTIIIGINPIFKEF